jgi:Calx-beta domain
VKAEKRRQKKKLFSITGDPNSTASVDFTTIDGTVLAGSDYQATSGTVSFAIGEMTKKITIPL